MSRSELPENEIVIYSDGACSGNPGPGGYGAILVYGEHEKELREGFRSTTNNRMEILGVIRGLQALKKPCEVLVVTDSRYVVDTITKGWAVKWRSKGWMRDKVEKAKNWDLWQIMLPLCEQHVVKWKWVRGHNGHVMNERADVLAVKARDDVKNYQIDEFFEAQKS
jgi:ribonuclease HI